MTLDLIRSLAREGEIFTIDQAEIKTSLKKSVLRVLLSRLEKKGLVERIEKGKYLIIPLDSSPGGYTLHEFVIGSYLIEPYAISYWSALHWYGLTEQIPSTVFIQTPSRKKKMYQDIFGVHYQCVRIKEDKFYGIRNEWIEEVAVRITDREKTIVDCLDKPQYSGGILEVYKALSHKTLVFDKMSTYAQKIGNAAVIKRLGYLCDLNGISIDLPIPQSRTYELLDPTMPKSGTPHPKWKLIINLNDLTPEDKT